jgi:hypothetical protein
MEAFADDIVAHFDRSKRLLLHVEDVTFDFGEANNSHSLILHL